MTLEEVRGIYTRVSTYYSSNYPDAVDEMETAVKFLHREMQKDETLTEEKLLEKVQELKMATEPQYRSKFATQVIGLFWTKTFIEPIRRNRFDPKQHEQSAADRNGEWLKLIERNRPD